MVKIRSAATAKEAQIETHVAPIRRLSAMLLQEVALGFHFCFGTFGGWLAFAPPELARTVELVNASTEAAGHRTDWIHIPVLNRADGAFHAPLARLEPRGARVYLGMIQSMDSFAQRLATAREFLPDFGLAAYCGFGRTPPAQLPQILEDHLRAVSIAG